MKDEIKDDANDEMFDEDDDDDGDDMVLIFLIYISSIGSENPCSYMWTYRFLFAHGTFM